MDELGRPPQEDEFAQVAAIKELMGTWKRALNFLKRFQGDELLVHAFDSRRDDLTIYFAMRRFEVGRVYRQLPESLKRDVKTFFGNYQQAQQAGETLLFSAGDAQAIRQLCQQAAETGYGYLDDEGAFTFHTTQTVLLPPLLRVYIGCATQVFGDVTTADLLKIHSESGKLSLMKYDDFDGLALPRMLERIKISLANQRFDYYKYGELYQYPVNDTPINFNLTNNSPPVTLSKEALLGLVEWCKAQNDRKSVCEQSELAGTTGRTSRTVTEAVQRDGVSGLAGQSEHGGSRS